MRKGSAYIPASEVFYRLDTNNIEKPKQFNINDPNIFNKKKSVEKNKKNVSESSVLTI